MTVVLDASAVLAWLQQEPGGAEVKDMLDGGTVTAANWSELLQKVRQHGGKPEEVGLLLRSLGLDVADVTRIDGERAPPYGRARIHFPLVFDCVSLWPIGWRGLRSPPSRAGR